MPTSTFLSPISRAKPVAGAALALALAACGGGSSGSAAGGGGAVAVAPTPTPAPTATSTPIPTPTPTSFSTAAIAGALPGQSLRTAQACAFGDFTFAGSPPRLSGIGTIYDTGAFNGAFNGAAGNGLDIVYRGSDSYDLIFGFDDVGLIRPGDKRPSATAAYDNFNLGNGFEFEIYRNVGAQSLQRVTIGREGSPIGADPKATGYTCFYAAGLSDTSLPGSGTTNYAGFADGIALIGGKASRLFGSTATASLDYAARTGTLRIDLAGRDAPFGEFLDAAATPSGRTTIQFKLSSNPGFANYVEPVSIEGPGPATGDFTGIAFDGGAAIGFVFTLTLPNGDRVFGVAAVEPP